MSDIVLYLDKKAYQYQLLTEKHQFSLLVFITNNH
jgi:hypothetical protein